MSCGLTPLSTRRDYNDNLFHYKLLNGKVVCPKLLNKINIRIPEMNTRTKNTLHIENCTKCCLN